MKTLKYLPLGLVVGAAFSLASCDDTLDCGCECNTPKAKSFEFLDPSTMSQVKKDIKNKVSSSQADSFKLNKVAAGTTVIVYGENLSEVTSIKFGSKEATLYPTLINDNQIVFKVPEGITEPATAMFCTKACPTGVKGLPKVFLGAPCVTMCDNEFAIKTMKIRGNSLVEGLTAWFWDDDTNDYTIKGECKVEDGTTDAATVMIPSKFGKNHPIKFTTGAGETFSEFIFHDERCLLISRDDEELNKFMKAKPDWNIDEENPEVDAALIREGGSYTKQDLTRMYFNSENTNGNFSIFYSDRRDDYPSLSYDLEFADDNGADIPGGTVFGANRTKTDGLYGDDALDHMDKYCIKFEVNVPEDMAMKGGVISVGFSDGSGDDFKHRDYCAVFQPAKVDWDKPATGDWQIKGYTPWSSGGDWLTICILMDDMKYNFTTGNYQTSAENGRTVDGDTYKYFGDNIGGLAYYVKNPAKVRSDDEYSDFRNPYQKLAIGYNQWDDATSGTEFVLAIDNVRIGLNDGNGGIYRSLDWGVPIQDFYVAPRTSCKQ